MFYQLIVNKNAIFYDNRKPEAATAVWRAPDDGHNNARNMLSSVCTTKQIKNFTIDCCIWLGVLLEWLAQLLYNAFSNRTNQLNNSITQLIEREDKS